MSTSRATPPRTDAISRPRNVSVCFFCLCVKFGQNSKKPYSRNTDHGPPSGRHPPVAKQTLPQSFVRLQTWTLCSPRTCQSFVASAVVVQSGICAASSSVHVRRLSLFRGAPTLVSPSQPALQQIRQCPPLTNDIRPMRPQREPT